tara:strand:+ start:782 stop:955 length:174 start_codon:yes stop_codon:yes gene_type:complete
MSKESKVKITPELGAAKDGYQTGGKKIEYTDPSTSQTVEVRGMRRMLASKSKKATWY